MDVVLHYTTEKYVQKNVFLNDADYGQALDCLVKGVCDTLLFRSAGDDAEHKVFLGQRKVQPQPDWWAVGGRMKCGETAKEAAMRNVFRETGIQPKRDDLTFINVYTFSFGMRQQAPQTNGACDVSIFHAFEVPSGVEPKLDADEYRTGMWFNASEVMNNPRFHPALQRCIFDYRMRRAQVRLHRVIADSPSDSTAILARAQDMRPYLTDGGSTVTEVHFKNEQYVYVQGDGNMPKSIPEAPMASKVKIDFVPLVSVFLIGIFTGWMIRR